ncbi:hypothetical protein P1X14_15355 [Sphingomonas sp. AOB5]|uniref:hypothetical protein n=1 Tax=Sphingomonas sp. AOB5 TaxID=3034017 RepID=UPI0023F871F2|nr:hypothetical protein [Sphingomonas sp. AOB5]MDF7776633.1 hypothetical protein [Sphingomonas sp. AOB5]
MKSMIRMMLVTGAAAMSIGAAQAQARENGARDMMLELGGGMRGEALEAAIKEAEAYPLGSKENPVRENQPRGQWAYLRRLRCASGEAPSFNRAGNVGEGPFGFIVDLYKVTCPGQAPVDIYIDMYHDGGETRPVPGFTIVEK